MVNVYGLGYPWSIPLNLIYFIADKKKKSFYPSKIIDFIGTNICTIDFLKHVHPFTRTIKGCSSQFLLPLKHEDLAKAKKFVH